MTAGIPIVSRDVGGVAQLIDDPLTAPDGHTWGPCGYSSTALCPASVT